MHISLNMMCKIEHYQIIAQYVDEQIAAKAERVHINHICGIFTIQHLEVSQLNFVYVFAKLTIGNSSKTLKQKSLIFMNSLI